MLLQPGKAGRHRWAPAATGQGHVWGGRFAMAGARAGGQVISSALLKAIPQQQAAVPPRCGAQVGSLSQGGPATSLSVALSSADGCLRARCKGWGESLAEGRDLPSDAHCHTITLSASNVTKQGLREPPSSPEALDAGVSPPGERGMSPLMWAQGPDPYL